MTPMGRDASGPAGARIYVEPWPAGGWVVRLAHHPAPLSRHDSQQEAEFHAAAYRRAIAGGRRLVFGRPSQAPARAPHARQ
jgi:hypothetical protein